MRRERLATSVFVQLQEPGHYQQGENVAVLESVTSDLRIGAPAVTTCGLQGEECRQLAGWICDILDHLGDADVEAHVAMQLAQSCVLPTMRNSKY